MSSHPDESPQEQPEAEAVQEPVVESTAHGLDDDMWWVRSLGGPPAPEVDPLLPTSERLRREIAALPSTLAELDGEDEVRAAVAALNSRVADWARHLVVSDTAPQPTGIGPVDLEDAVARWEAARTRGDEPAVPAARRRPWRRR